ncbi:sentrin-specific protease 5 [Discoglossus pictus]
MKQHRKAIHRKRSLLLSLSKSWTTHFGGFKKYCSFQTRQPVISLHSQINSVGGVKKAGLCEGEQLTGHSTVTPNQSYRPIPAQHCLKKPKQLNKLILCNFALGRAILSKKNLRRSLRTKKQVKNRDEKLVTGRDVLNNALCRHSCDYQGISILQTKEKRQSSKCTHTDDTVVIFNSLRKVPSPLRRKCFGGLWLKRNCNLFSRGKVPLFMMHKKLSVFTTCGRLQSQKLRARNRSFKLENNKAWNQNTFWNCCRKSLRGKVQKAVCFLKSKIQSPVQNKNRPSDMNNITSGILYTNQLCSTNNCLRDETIKLQSIEGQIGDVVTNKQILKIVPRPLHETAVQWENIESVPRKISEVTVGYSFPDDVHILVAEKEISISCQEDADVHGGDCDELMLLTPDKLQLCMHGNAGYQENIPMELVENGDDTSHMDMEESKNSDVFNTKLLDHPYCKSPPQQPSSEEAHLVSEKMALKNVQKVISCVSDGQLASFLWELLNDIMKKYGSLIPLSEKDVLTRLKEVFNEDFSNRTSFISKEIMKYRAKHSKAVVCNFRVFYNKHMLDMDDLATLDGQNWLNDQVINMYGELIMDAVPDKVHFLNSFFHRQLVTKGYNGVKRWTKKVDFFKKTLLLIPIHLEVHWSLITVNIPNKIISFYDSQGIHFKFCVENIRKYLLTEAREKNHPEFLQGWQTAVTKCIPQQKNDSDCGVFVLQYCKCLALEQPFQFSQEDMPRVRKRIYKELCECRLMD